MAEAPSAGAASEAPRATYRLQLHPSFAFDAAAEVVGYLQRLGVSHVYCSPYLQARAGSGHGYDVTDHSRVNGELGGEAGLDHFVATLRDHNMGHILDFVPNHMGVGGSDNAWWLDVLEWGADSPYSAYFDIDWAPANPSLRGKVLLPFLGRPYGDALEAGELRIAFSPEAGAIDAWFYEHRFPIAVKDYARLLAPAVTQLRRQRGHDDDALAELDGLVSEFQEFRRRPKSARGRTQQRKRALALKQRLAELAGSDAEVTDALSQAVGRLNGSPGDLDSFEALHRLLNRQHYRVAWWRVAGDEVNYRRFFDINDLAGLRMENPQLFEHAHSLVLRLIGEGKLDGLRLDHIDGLFDPAGYLRRLQSKAAQAQGASVAIRRDGQGRTPAPFYTVVEKILEPGEALPRDWACAGTTGYEVCNDILGLFIDPAAQARMDRLYRRFTGRSESFDAVLAAAKARVMSHELAGEMEVLATDLWHIAGQAPRTRDYTLNGLRDGLREVVVHMPVYRTYVTRQGASAQDRHAITEAVRAAGAARPDVEPGLLSFIHMCLTGDLVRGRAGGRYNRNAVLDFAMKAQQYTGPVMAKGLEDTALYRYFRHLAVNEVGSDPRTLGVVPESFHERNAARARDWPTSMVTLATHDTKRGADVRARLAVISEWPGAWQAYVRQWQSAAESFRTRLADGRTAPDANDIYLIFQTLLGAWPAAGLPDDAALSDFRERLEGYLVKALRESKRHSQWARPDPAYEEATLSYVRSLLTDATFRDRLDPVQRQVAWYGMLNGLAQVTLALTVPGVPDIYQGNELWDLNLVDPDNRRPIAFDQRSAMLAELEELYAQAWPAATALTQRLQAWPDGAIKLLLTWRLLRLRASLPDLFAGGGYRRLEPAGGQADHVVAFARMLAGRWVVVAVPRLVAGLAAPETPPLGSGVWGDTVIQAPRGRAPHQLQDSVTGRWHDWPRSGLPVGAVFRDLPVAVLVSGGVP